MKNITISIDDEVLEAGRDYAKAHNTSLNALIRRLLKQTVVKQSSGWLDECFELMDKQNASTKGKPWNRKELYDV